MCVWFEGVFYKDARKKEKVFQNPKYTSSLGFLERVFLMKSWEFQKSSSSSFILLLLEREKRNAL